MHHTVANFVSLGTVADTDVPALSDDITTISNSHFLFQQDRQLIWAYAGSAGVSQVRLVTPSMRQITRPRLRPLNGGVTPTNNPNIADYRATPLKIRGLEEFQVLATTATSPGPENFYAVFGLLYQYTPFINADVFTLHGASTTAAVTSAWTSIAVTWDDTLPVGTYAIGGLEVRSANAVAARLILKDQIHRPGSISVTSLQNRSHVMFYKGGLGQWGTFTTTAMPTVQVLCNSTDASHDLYLDIARIG